MNGQFFWGIQLFMQVIWIIQILNLSIHNRKDVLLIDLFILLFNSSLIFNLDSIDKLSVLLHIINLSIIFLFYKENPKKSIVAFAFAYFVVRIINFLQIHDTFIKMIEVVIRTEILEEYHEIINLCFFVLFMIISRIFYKYIKKYIHIISKNIISTISIIISGFFFDIIIISEINRNIYTVILINKIMIINILLFTAAIVYTTIKFNYKLDSMGELNKALELKNNELRQIKHDYGAQISYLYGLYLLKRWNDLGKALEDIYRKNNEVSNVVSIRDDENSIIYKALKPALDDGVHILLEESIDSAKMDINDDILFYILSVIRENTLKYMEHDGIMIVRVYKAFENAVIEIENSCAHVKKRKFISVIKEFYFNSIDGWEEVYNLNEIKRLIEENNGDMYVRNKYVSTLINISIPLVNAD